MGTRAARLCRRALLAALAAVALMTTLSATAAAMPLGGDRHPNAALIRLGTPDRRAVPILMYHVIQRPYANSPYPDLYVPRAEFAAQMNWLERNGYEAVTLDRVYDAWHGDAVLPARPIVLSFDDGYRSHYTNALPILRDHGWPGVLNLDLSNLAPSWGIRPAMVRRARRGGLGARRPLAYARRPHRPERIVAAPRGGRLTRGDPRAVRRRRQLLLLPGRTLRLSGHRGRSCRRVPRGHHHGVRARPE